MKCLLVYNPVSGASKKFIKLLPYVEKELVKKFEDVTIRPTTYAGEGKKIAKEACEQSKRNKLVKVEKVCDEDSILNYKSKLNLVAYEDVSAEGCNKLYNLLSKKFDSITLVVGPEGGFEQREIDNLVDNGFEVVSLGKRILRSETAPLFLMSIISYMYECGENNEEI